MNYSNKLMIFSNRFMIFVVAIFLSLSVNAKDRNEELQDIAKYRGYVDLMQSYYDVIITTHDISEDAVVSAVFQLQKIGDFYKEAGETEKVLGIYESILAKTKNQTVRNAAYNLLSERYRELGRHKDGIEVLQKALEENLQLIKQPE